MLSDRKKISHVNDVSQPEHDNNRFAGRGGGSMSAEQSYGREDRGVLRRRI